MSTATVGIDRPVALNLRDIPSGLRQRFKIACCEQEISMTEAIVAFMQTFVECGDTSKAAKFVKKSQESA